MSNTQHKTLKGETMKTAMSYSRACELLGLTTPKSLTENARLAESALRAMTTNTPLRFKVAADVLVKAEK